MSQCGVRKWRSRELARDRLSRCCSRPMCWRWPRRCRSPIAAERLGEQERACGASSNTTSGGRWRSWICRGCGASALAVRSTSSARRGHDYISLFVDLARRKVVYVADGIGRGHREGIVPRIPLRGAWRPARTVTDASIDMGAAFEAGIKENFLQLRDLVRQISRHQTRQRGRRPGAARWRRGTTSRSRAGATSS